MREEKRGKKKKNGWEEKGNEEEAMGEDMGSERGQNGNS